MDKLRAKITELIENYEASIEETEEMMGDDFNPMDASGGNFDDAYEMGFDHGENRGKLSILRSILKEIDEDKRY